MSEKALRLRGVPCADVSDAEDEAWLLLIGKRNTGI